MHKIFKDSRENELCEKVFLLEKCGKIIQKMKRMPRCLEAILWCVDIRSDLRIDRKKVIRISLQWSSKWKV